MGWLLTGLQLVAWSCWIVDAGRRFSLGSSRGAESWSQNQIETSDGERLPSESYMNTAKWAKGCIYLLPQVQLVRKEGYPVEEHQVTTQDGYQLTLHRIPSRYKNAPVVHLQHGILGASDFWVITPRDKSLGVQILVEVTESCVWFPHFTPTQISATTHRASIENARGDNARWLQRPLRYRPRADDQQVAVTRCLHMTFILADYGYDVWLGNIRGNFYSRKHVTLSPDKSKFWNFSMHEMGIYDVPAMIDHILLTTGQDKIFYVGHSMGTTMFYVMASSRPEYNSKIRLMVALAPVVYFHELKFPILQFVTPRTDEVSVKEGFGNQINLCWDRGLNPGPPAQKSDTLPLDHQVTIPTSFTLLLFLLTDPRFSSIKQCWR
uniref:Triacylglycerol lipase n=1 Tax=Timema poppense TaxID=170557 RepID=A0A7R9GT36_TIMPO|nr:unnamed protein product [Timema poppensis]